MLKDLKLWHAQRGIAKSKDGGSMFKVEVKSQCYMSNEQFITPNITGVCELVEMHYISKPEGSDMAITITETNIKYWEK